VAFRFGSTSAPQQPSARTRNVVEDEGAEGVVHWLMMLMGAASGKKDGKRSLFNEVFHFV
jgi:hypothetical protein